MMKLNNPGNIRMGATPWKGEIRPSNHRSFCTFQSMPYGYRAMHMILRKYRKGYGLKTIRQMMHKYCPYGDAANNPDRYAEYIQKFTGINPDAELNVYDETQMCAVVAAMTRVENGVMANMDDVRKGYRMI